MILMQPQIADAQGLTFPGICDASAALAIDEKTIIVGDDEQQFLAVYDLPTQRLLSKIALPLPAQDRAKRGNSECNHEADLEGATIYKDRFVWIASHGRNRKGAVCPNRSKLFASHRLAAPGGPELAFSPSFSGLLPMIVAKAAIDSSYAVIAEAIGDLSQTEPDLAPKRRGLNIEGLTAAKDGETLLIGLRNPQDGGKAILFELAGFGAFLTGDQNQLALGASMRVDLGGRGIRDISWSPAHEAYIIVAGQTDDSVPGPGFAFYKWDGVNPPAPMGDFSDQDADFHPEAAVPLLDKSSGDLTPSKRILFLSDEGAVPLAYGAPCKKAPESAKRFRGIVRQVD